MKLSVELRLFDRWTLFTLHVQVREPEPFSTPRVVRREPPEPHVPEYFSRPQKPKDVSIDAGK